MFYISIPLPLFPTSFKCNSISFSDRNPNILVSLLLSSSPTPDFQWPGTVIQKLLFSIVILKRRKVALKEVTGNSHFSSSTEFFGGLEEKVSICLFILNSTVSCGLVLFVQLRYQYFLIKNNIALFI